MLLIFFLDPNLMLIIISICSGGGEIFYRHPECFFNFQGSVGLPRGQRIYQLKPLPLNLRYCKLILYACYMHLLIYFICFFLRVKLLLLLISKFMLHAYLLFLHYMLISIFIILIYVKLVILVFVNIISPNQLFFLQLVSFLLFCTDCFFVFVYHVLSVFERYLLASIVSSFVVVLRLRYMSISDLEPQHLMLLFPFLRSLLYLSPPSWFSRLPV